MEKEILNFNGKDWIVMLTRKAMLEIEEVQKRKTRKIANDENSIELICRATEMQDSEEKMKEIQKMKDGKRKEEKLSEYMKEYLPIVLKMQASDVMDEPLTPFDLIYIVIRCNPHNPELTKGDYEKGLFELEEKYGIIELEKKFKGMYDKVFQEINLIKKALEETDQVEKTEKIN